MYVSSSGLISPLLATSPPECLDLQLDYWNVDSKLELGPREKLQKKDSKASLKTTFKCVRVYRLPQTPTTDLASAALAMVVITKEKKQKSRCSCMTPIALYFKVLGTFLQTKPSSRILRTIFPNPVKLYLIEKWIKIQHFLPKDIIHRKFHKNTDAQKILVKIWCHIHDRERHAVMIFSL